MSPKVDIDSHIQDLEARAPGGAFFALHIRFALPLISHQSFPEAWVRRYTEEAYALRDPVIAWGFSTTGACRWSEIELPDPFDIFGQARRFGMVYGVAVSCGPMMSRSIASACRADREFTDVEMAEIERILARLHELTEPPGRLTKAQVEALRCVAAGDRHAAAAAKLGISESAFKARLSSARAALLARTTTEAVQRARDARLI
ncbi:autoinducer binding domain-containing protein [Limimaricola variabilis]|uniref:autoinducer binding domain-containing protein n=1 Tax=Limimaricola variabilis TaxID=1492771 RepID=UPI002AC8D559|nr:autoinducer binding domain-containing protein [Limimaricola variabilis]WPY93930.1 autoinducer binding domain-containing protein [Limimaricola variabilis]